MATTRVQFQAGLSDGAIPGAVRHGGLSAQVVSSALASGDSAARPAVIGAAARSSARADLLLQCRVCRHRWTTLLAGTLFEATKLLLTTWFLALHLLTASKTNVAALELKRHLGVTTAPPGASSTRSCRP